MSAGCFPVGAFVVTIYDGLATFVQGLDLTPVTTRIFDALHIPPDMRNLSISAFIGIVGLLISYLRSAPRSRLNW